MWAGWLACSSVGLCQTLPTRCPCPHCRTAPPPPTTTTVSHPPQGDAEDRIKLKAREEAEERAKAREERQDGAMDEVEAMARMVRCVGAAFHRLCGAWQRRCWKGCC